MILINEQDKKETQDFVHYPVMLQEAVEWLDCREGLIYIDATLGGGGHSKAIAQKIGSDSKDSRLISFDVDPVAIKAAEKNLAPWKAIVTIVKANYSKIPEVLQNLNIDKITGGILFDLGASYPQLTSADKGFSFSKEAPLDMRFDPESALTAYDVVNKFSETDLFKIFKEYGEERFSRKIARKIVDIRQKQPIKTTVELADIVRKTIYSPNSKIHPATRVFQAIRIAVNDELKNLHDTLTKVIPLLESDARIVVISFHSLEDRLVKNAFKYYSSNCRCLPENLICSCEPGQLEILTKKPIIASSEEIKTNPPSRSAKLRAARKIT